MAAINIDGVLLSDTFSPVLRSLVEKLGIEYTPRLERALFSRPQSHAAQYLIRQYNLSYTPEELVGLFFDERESHIANNPELLADGIGSLLNVLMDNALTIICYGGLGEQHFKKELKDYLSCFDRYVCTNDFRPGIREIIHDICHTESSRIVFIDDVNTVAEAARQYNAPFIGVPSTGFQKQDMIQTGVKFMVASIRDIDMAYIGAVDDAAHDGSCW